MAVLKLPRMPDGAAIVNTQNGKPITALTRAWDAAMSQIEDNLNGILAAQDAADAAQSDADAALAAAIAAQADADAAMAAAIAAQATADDAKATADALDAALNVTAGKVLTVLNTMTLAAIDGSTLNIGTGGTLGTAAYTNATDYLPSGSSGAFLAKASNLSDVASVPTARSNLGITATGADTAYAFRANNLSDLGSISTARTNLGLGTAATQNTGTSGANVPLLNGANTWGATQTFGAVTATSVTGATLTLGTTGAQPLILQVNNAERARVTPAGYFKADPAGAYAFLASPSHEFVGVTGNEAVIMTNPGASPYGAQIKFTASPNNAGNYFLVGVDGSGIKVELYSNGGLGHVIANDVSLSDESVKGAIERYSETQLDALERSFLNVNWCRYKFLDQTHDDWNHGYTAQGVEEAFALTAPELVDETKLGTKAGSGETRKGVYDADLTHIGLALLARGLKRIEAMESKMYAAGIT